jgi:hypothetical protein
VSGEPYIVAKVPYTNGQGYKKSPQAYASFYGCARIDIVRPTHMSVYIPLHWPRIMPTGLIWLFTFSTNVHIYLYDDCGSLEHLIVHIG